MMGINRVIMPDDQKFRAILRYTGDESYSIGTYIKATAEELAERGFRPDLLGSFCWGAGGEDIHLKHIGWRDILDLPVCGFVPGANSALYSLTADQELAILELENIRALAARVEDDHGSALAEGRRRDLEKRAELPQGAVIVSERTFRLENDDGKRVGTETIIEFEGQRYGFRCRNLFDVGMVINPFLHVEGGIALFNKDKEMGWERSFIAGPNNDPRKWVPMSAAEQEIYLSLHARMVLRGEDGVRMCADSDDEETDPAARPPGRPKFSKRKG